ncbi:MAG: hypothetical protein J6B97_09900 [Bacteroidales bacterium]|nr:hypothetical protein [Bacteroidales bacterium]MBO5570513.1 hypothetical protein [Clostridia bacterium]
MDKKLLAAIAAETVNGALKQIDTVTSNEEMNYIVTYVMGILGTWIR